MRSPRVSGDSRSEHERELSDEVERTGEIHPRDVTAIIDQRPVGSETATIASQRTIKPVARDDTAEGLWQAAQQDAAAPSPTVEPSIETESEPEPAPETPEEKSNDVDNEVRAEKSEAVRDSIKSTASLEVTSENPKEGQQRLSITIPGSFED
jgi:hypothetical protein